MTAAVNCVALQRDVAEADDLSPDQFRDDEDDTDGPKENDRPHESATVTGWPKLGTHLEEVCAMKKILVTLATLAVSAGIALAGAPSAQANDDPACAGTAVSGRLRVRTRLG